jgi:signal transduction histidine kinase
VPRTFIVTSDITERAEAYHTLEQAVADRTRELSILLDISARLASTLQLEPLLNLILDHIRDLLPYSGAAIFTLKDDVLHVLAYQLPGLPSLPTPLRLPLDQAGPYLTVIEQRQVLVLDDVACDPPLARAIRSTTGRDAHSDFTHAHSWVGIPLVVRDKAEGLLSLTHAQPGFYTARHAQLAQAVAHHAASAIDNARLYEQAQALAAVEERQRLARELHDSATQLLYGITLMAGASSKALNSGNLATLKDSLGEIKQHALQALQEMRLLILELDPPLLQEAGLTAALKTSLSSIETRTGLHTDFEARDLERLPASVEMALYRIAMEALNNLVRYARAQDAQVRLWREDGCVHLEICDNGIGFDLEAVRRSSGMGLHSMEQRARQIGGRLDIVTAPGQGARILVTAPLQTELLFEPVLTQEIPTPNKTNDTNDFS